MKPMKPMKIIRKLVAPQAGHSLKGNGTALAFGIVAIAIAREALGWDLSAEEGLSFGVVLSFLGGRIFGLGG